MDIDQDPVPLLPPYGGAAIHHAAPGAPAIAGGQAEALTAAEEASRLTGQCRYVEAETAYRRAIALEPRLAKAHHGLATMLHAAGRLEDACDSYQTAQILDPESAEIRANYGLLLSHLGRSREAVAELECALRIKPDLAVALNSLGSLLIAAGDAERGIQLVKRAVGLAPSHPGFAANLLMSSHYVSSLSAGDIAKLHLAWGGSRAGLAAPRSSFTNARGGDRPLKVGYVSPDFRSHAVGEAIAPVLAAHDPGAVDITLYGEIAQPDEMTERFKALAQGWRSTFGCSDDEMVQQIRADRIDVLVDLAGYTERNRLGIFARRAAPIQVTWHGYPDTTGLGSMDYRLVDAVTDPEGIADALASETLIRLPHGFIGGVPHAVLPPVPPPPAFAKGHITFGSFNSFAKINSQVIALWSRVLGATPGSRLLLKSSNRIDAWAHHRLLAAFAAEGTSPDRIAFRARAAGTEEHLGLYGEVDIALDTFPYNGTSTTMESLLMGVPVVALLGSGHAARVSASILAHIGRPEWIAPDSDAYLRIASELARDRAMLARIRSRLRQDYLASSFADPARLARAVEQAYRGMWQSWLAG